MSEFVPVFARASAVACWWSIKRLIEQHPGDAWLWTFTFRDALSHNYAGNCHRILVTALNNDRRNGKWPANWGGVKVAEVHPGGHGLHFHWVLGGRVPIERLLFRAHQSGFGRIHVHERPCTERVAGYVAKYLTKKDRPVGVKAWGCLGSYRGVRVRDIEFDSESINVFRGAYREAIAAGKSRGAAYVHAKMVQRRYDVGADSNASVTNEYPN